MMRPAVRNLWHIGLLAVALVISAGSPADAQTAPARDDIIARLDRFETPADIDVPALRQQVLERSKS